MSSHDIIQHAHDRGDRRHGQHRHRPAGQGARSRRARCRPRRRHRRGVAGLARARHTGSRRPPRGSTGCCATIAASSWCSRRRRAKAHGANAPHYAEPGIRRSTSPRATVARWSCPPVNLVTTVDGAQRQPCHLRRPGHGSDRRGGQPPPRTSRTPRSSPRSRPARRDQERAPNIDEFTQTTAVRSWRWAAPTAARRSSSSTPSSRR